MRNRLTSLLLAFLLCINSIPAVVRNNDDARRTVHAAEVPQAEPQQLPAADMLLDSGNRAGPARAGKYLMTFQPIGETFADYYDMVVTVRDSGGNSLGRFPMGGYGIDLWELKRVPARINSVPATIEITCMYKLLGCDTYEQLTYEAPFEELCVDRVASAVSNLLVPGLEIDFCRYSIECQEDGAPIVYIDAKGGIHIQDNCKNISGDILTTGWYAVRESFQDNIIDINGDVNLVLCDEATLKALSGVTINPNSSLTIWCQSGRSGRLESTGYYAPSSGSWGDIYDIMGPGIYVDPASSLTINGGNITAIPGGDAHNSGIEIWSGAVGNRAAGIGGGSDRGGYNKDCGTITINGGTVTAYGGLRAAAIGGGYDKALGETLISGTGGVNGKVTINGGTVYALAVTGGAGIGTGANPDYQAGPIEINGGYVEARGGGGGGSGIGGGYDGANGDITITNGSVYAYHFKVKGTNAFSKSGTGIGAGDGKEQGGIITITGGTVLAEGYDGAGIGGGGYDIYGSNGGHAGGKIIISGGNVVATSYNGAGIGGGGSNDMGGTGNGGNITINGGRVTAVSYMKGAGIGGGNDGDSGTVTINDGYVFAVGGKYSKDWFDAAVDIYNNAEYYSDMNTSESLDAGILVGALLLGFLQSGDWGGAGIGGGDGHSGQTITINGGTVVATSGMNTAHAIGKGNDGDEDGDVSVYEYSKTTYADLNDDGSIGATTVVYGGAAGAAAATSHAYAKIEPGECTVTFEMNGHGIAPATQIVTRGQKAERPDDPEAEGWLFDDWYTDNTFATRFDFDAPIVRNTVVYARWVQSFDITVKKVWPEGAALPASVQIDYRNEYTAEKITNGSVTLTAANGWSAKIAVTEVSILTLTEQIPEGFVCGGWQLTNIPGGPLALAGENYAGRVTLNLRDPAALGLSQAQLEALHSGSGIIQLANGKARIYSAKVNWDIPQSRYKPDSVSAVLQHRVNGVWETVDTVELNADNDWTAPFEPLPETEGMDGEYRVRELSKDGSVVLDSADEGGGQDPSAVFSIQPWTDVDMDMTYRVSYAFAAAESRTTITNSAGQYYHAKIVWEGIEDENDMPDSVRVWLFKNGSVADSLELNKQNHWEGVFAGQMDEAEYKVREVDKDGNTVYMTGDPRPVYVEQPYDKATYYVTKNGITKIYEYDVSIQVDAAECSTVITNTRSGIIFTAKKEWNGPDDSPWPDRIYSVDAVLQKRTVNEDGTETWTNVESISLDVAHSWSAMPFQSVPITENFNEDDYRVREWIDKREFTAYESTMIDPGTVDGAEGRLMLLPTDKDFVSGTLPHFSCQERDVAQGEAHAGFTVSYKRDANGNFVIVNTQDGFFTVSKVWLENEPENDGGEGEQGGEAPAHTKPESVVVVLQHRAGNGWTEINRLTLNEQNNWYGSFDRVADFGGGAGSIDDYRVRELDKDGMIVLDPNDDPNDDIEPSDIPTAIFDVGGTDTGFLVTYTRAEGSAHTRIVNQKGKVYHVVVSWDIDMWDKDRTPEIDVALQRQEGKFSWKIVEIITVDPACNWKGDFKSVPIGYVNENGTFVQYNYRVRLLEPDDDEDGDEPQPGEQEDPLEAAKERIVHNWLDLDKPYIKNMLEIFDPSNLWTADYTADWLTLQAKNTFIPRAQFEAEIEEYTDGIGKTIEKHDSLYTVKYDHDSKTHTMHITNTATLEISIFKRWLNFEKDDMPESIWLMLVSKVQDDYAEAAGVEELNIYTPVATVLYGDQISLASIPGGEDGLFNDAVTQGIEMLLGKGFLSAVAGGVVDFFVKKYTATGVAIAEVDDDVNNPLTEWWAWMGVKKYGAYGVPMDFAGTELTTGLMELVIDAVIKYLGIPNIHCPVMYDPINECWSIKGYGICYPGIDEDYELTCNVINLKFHSGDAPDSVSGTKYWEGDNEADRPEEIKIHVYAKDKDGNRTEITGSPVTVTAEDDWKWSLDIPLNDIANVEENGEQSTVSYDDIEIEEEVPEGYEAIYSETGYDITNRSLTVGELLIVNTVTGAPATDNFLFEVERIDNEGSVDESFRKLTVIISGSGQVAVKCIDPGQYRVTELTGWSWRYNIETSEQVVVTVPNGGTATAAFRNKLGDKNWLQGETSDRETPAADNTPADDPGKANEPQGIRKPGGGKGLLL